MLLIMIDGIPNPMLECYYVSATTATVTWLWKICSLLFYMELMDFDDVYSAKRRYIQPRSTYLAICRGYIYVPLYRHPGIIHRWVIHLQNQQSSVNLNQQVSFRCTVLSGRSIFACLEVYELIYRSSAWPRVGVHRFKFSHRSGRGSYTHAHACCQCILQHYFSIDK
jgi:hypothetical protein